MREERDERALHQGRGRAGRVIASGAVSSSEVIEAHLARIEEVNPDLNAVTATLADEAREAAAAVDRSVAAGEQVGALAGVPFTVKENIDVAGSATTWGVVAFAEQIAPTDASSDRPSRASDHAGRRARARGAPGGRSRTAPLAPAGHRACLRARTARSPRALVDGSSRHRTQAPLRNPAAGDVRPACDPGRTSWAQTGEPKAANAMQSGVFGPDAVTLLTRDSA
jgi:hypothetical protein